MREFLLTDRDENNTTTLFVGTTEEIKALYKSIQRNSPTIIPTFCDPPKFSDNKMMYGLCIDDDNSMQVVNSDTALSLLFNNNEYGLGYDIKEVENKSHKQKTEALQQKAERQQLFMGRSR